MTGRCSCGTWKAGKNDIKFGFEFRRTSISQIFNRRFRGGLDFPDFASFLQGIPDGGTQYAGDTNRNTFENSYSGYFQDSVHLSRTFVLRAYGASCRYSTCSTSVSARVADCTSRWSARIPTTTLPSADAPFALLAGAERAAGIPAWPHGHAKARGNALEFAPSF